MSRLIDADALEKEGWILHRTVRVDRHALEYQVKQIAKVPTVEPSAQPEPYEDAVRFLREAITATNGKTVYDVGFRNGIRLAISVLTDEKPQFENCESCEDTVSKPPLRYSGTRCKDCRLRNKPGCPVDEYIPEDSEEFCYFAERKRDR